MKKLPFELSILISLFYASFCVYILSTGINSDFERYIFSFSNIDPIFSLDSLFEYARGNILANFLFFHFARLFSAINNYESLAYIFFFLQSFLRSLVFFSLINPLDASLLLFATQYQIDLNQARFGFASSFAIILIYWQNCISFNRKSFAINLNSLFVQALNVILSFSLHFQSILIFLIHYFPYKYFRRRLFFKTMAMTSFVLVLFPLIPSMLSLLGITMRYFNNTTDQRGFALSLIFYIPACWIMILEITRYISTKSKTVILSNSQRFSISPRESISFISLSLLIISFCLFSENTTYMNRMVWVYSIVYVPTLVCSSTQCSA